jgi:hypothetical protein
VVSDGLRTGGGILKYVPELRVSKLKEGHCCYRLFLPFWMF